MTPKHMVTFVDGNKTIGEMAEFIQKTNHSRLPVFDGEENNIIGIVHQRNLLLAITKGELTQPIKNYAWDAMIVPETRIIDDLLKDMREKRAQLAVVVSEYGNIVGVVGIEDIIEELVGEIIDEKDIVPETIKRVSKNEILVHGQTRISYVNQFFNTDIKSKKTVNGFLLDKLGELPREGQTFEVKDIKFVVEMVGPRTIDRVRITKKTEAAQEAGSK
jgi:putative hemolysin